MNGPQPPLNDLQLAAYAHSEGFRGEGLLTIVATALGESGGDPDIVGDESLVGSKWGPSIGLTQVRCLWAERGTGRPRDCDRLDEPAFNLRSAYSISSGGTNFQPWTVFTSGRYRSYLDRAWKAVAGVGKAGPASGLAGAGGLQTLAGAELPGSGFVEAVVEPVTTGLARIALVGVAITGAVALIAAGGWKAVGGRQGLDEAMSRADQVTGVPIGASMGAGAAA